jgi:hypothetical protein
MESDTEYFDQANEIAGLIAAQSKREPSANDLRTAHAILDAGFRKHHELLRSWEKRIEALIASGQGS